jgi:hypothetical protein
LSFAYFSALFTHLEAGNCITNLQDLNRLILRFPEHWCFIVSELRHSISSPPQRQQESRDALWDMDTQNCLCPYCDRTFEYLAQLKQHLAGPGHDPSAFRCPDLACDSRFTCLSALLQHVENSSCSEGVNQGTGSLGRLWHFLLGVFVTESRNMPQLQRKMESALFALTAQTSTFRITYVFKGL